MALPIRNSRLRLSAGQVFWREVGAGVPVVFLHGSWADSEQWMPLLQVMGDRHHSLALDLLGFGESARPKIRYTLELETNVLTEWLDALRVEPAYFVAEGLGGWVATNFALRFPERVRGLVLLAPEGVSIAAGRWRGDRALIGRLPFLAWMLQLFAPCARLLGWRWVLRGLARRRQLRQFPAACQILFRRRSREIKAEQVSDRIPYLKAPVLILQGESASDPAVLALNQAYQKAPGAELAWVPGGDEPLQTEVGAIARHIQQFIQTH